MGNTSVKPANRSRYKKQVHWKAADRPSPPGKPQLVSESDITPDVVTIRWDPPKYDGGSPIIGYLVEHRRYGSPHWVRATPILVKFSEVSLSGLEPGWRYQFRVSAENAVGLSSPGELSELLTVTLQRSAVTAPRFLYELKNTIALENEKIECVAEYIAQPTCNISWFKDGFEVFSSRRIRITTENNKSILTIHQAALSDEGEIKCTATNRAGHASTKASLTVEASPSIRLPRQYEDGLLFELGETANLKVSIAGRPAPLVFWSHNNNSITNDDHYQIETTDKYTSLRIEQIKRSDRGEYEIRAINKLNENFASFLVTVTDKPSPPGQARVIMSLGRSVTLSWNTPQDDGGCKIGNYIVEYYRIGWDVWLKASTSRQLTTTIGDLIEGSEYKFRVKAESPYGISEPSRESDTIFIPDAKRGILSPSMIKSSHSNEIILEKKRSSKSPDNIKISTFGSQVPVRPVRSKLKSPSITPISSPLSKKRNLKQILIDQSLFDRTSIDRDLAYGTPDITIKTPSFQEVITSSTNENLEDTINMVRNNQQKDKSPELFKELKVPKKVVESENFNIEEIPIEEMKLPYTTNEFDENKKIYNLQNNEVKIKNETFSNSTEFLLVLLPEQQKGSAPSRQFYFDENVVPPPMSLSAPELGSELEIFDLIRMAVSSTELLHEKSMARFYNELHSNENMKHELFKETPSSLVSIPTIQISFQENDIDSEIENTSTPNVNEIGNLQRLKNDFRTLSIEERRQIFNVRQRSHSEELEEEEFEKVRKKMKLNKNQRKEVTISKIEDWEDLPGDVKAQSEKFDKHVSEVSDEFGRREIPPSKAVDRSKDPFEILNKPNPLPDPNFVPKPILKQKSDFKNSDHFNNDNTNANIQTKNVLTENSFYAQNISSDLIKEKSPVRKREGSPMARPLNISDIAHTSVISKFPTSSKLQNKSNEEIKVVVDHYGDIVKNYGQKKQTIPTVYLNAEDLKAAAKSQSEEESDEIDKSLESSFSDNEEQQGAPNIQRKRSFTEASSALLKAVKDKVSAAFATNDTEEDIISPSEDSRFLQAQSITRRGSSQSKRKQSIKPSSSNKSDSSKIAKKFSSMKMNPHSENWSNLRSPSPNRQISRSSPTPIRKTSVTLQNSQTRRNSLVSTPPKLTSRPKMREMTTQTSIHNEIPDPKKDILFAARQEELSAKAEIKVRTTVEYITDVAMFILACWLYLFQNELLAIPVLLVMVYRQLAEKIKKKLPSWLTRGKKPKRK